MAAGEHRRALSIWSDIVNFKPNKAPSTHRTNNLFPENAMDDRQTNGLFSMQYPIFVKLTIPFATLESSITASYKRRKMVNPKFYLTIGVLS
jgi:hypothetical protein